MKPLKFIRILEDIVNFQRGITIIFAALFVYTFLKAYMNGNQIVFHINTLGEANLELGIIIAYLLLTIVRTFYELKKPIINKIKARALAPPKEKSFYDLG